MNALVAAMVNGALVSAVLTALVWRRVLNAATRYEVWWLMLAVTVILPLAFLPMRTSARPTDPGRAARPAASPEPVRMVHSVPLPVADDERGDGSITVAIPAGRWLVWIAVAWLLTSALMLLA